MGAGYRLGGGGGCLWGVKVTPKAQNSKYVIPITKMHRAYFAVTVLQIDHKHS